MVGSGKPPSSGPGRTPSDDARNYPVITDGVGGAAADGRKTLYDGGHVLRRRAATSAHQAQAEFPHELPAAVASSVGDSG
jgi:hypothetical protein